MVNYGTCLERSHGIISSYGAIINFTPSGELWNLSEEISPVVIASYGAIINFTPGGEFLN